MWAEELRYESSSLPIFCAACLVCTLHFLVGGHESTSCFLHLRPKKKLNGNLFGKMPPIKKFIAKGRILGLTTKFRSLKSLENWRVCFDVCLQFWPNFACDDQTSKLSHLFFVCKTFLYWGRRGLVWIFMGDYKLSNWNSRKKRQKLLMLFLCWFHSP